MYESDGEKYFVVDGHLHFWDASPENWVKGQEQYAKGWIECFHAYQGLGPPETHWPIEKFQKYTEEDFVRDVFEQGHVDVGIFQSTYLRSWYTDGFNTAAKNATLAEKYPDKLIVNGRFDPREGEAGLKQLEEDAKRYNLKGVKVYTAEWYNGSTPTRARRSGRWTRTASTSRTSTSPRRASRSSTSSSSTWGCRGSRTSASWQRRSPTSMPASPS
jgi:hypothetical protein